MCCMDVGFDSRAYRLQPLLLDENVIIPKSCLAYIHLLGLKSPLEEAQKRSKAEAVHVVDL